MKSNKSLFARIAVGAGILVTGVSAFAQSTIDVSGVTGALTNVSAAVATVGAAVLVVYVGVKAYKYIRAAL
jgi:hypothetical protein